MPRQSLPFSCLKTPLPRYMAAFWQTSVTEAMAQIFLSLGSDESFQDVAFPDFLVSRIAGTQTSTGLTRAILSFRKRDQSMQQCLQQNQIPPKILGTGKSLVSGSLSPMPLLRDDCRTIERDKFFQRRRRMTFWARSSRALHPCLVTI